MKLTFIVKVDVKVPSEAFEGIYVDPAPEDVASIIDAVKSELGVNSSTFYLNEKTQESDEMVLRVEDVFHLS